MFDIVRGIVQGSFEDLGTPLADVTFCVVDLETTGGSALSEITEVGACKVQRGEIVGTFQTLVKPAEPVPAFIRLLTGISDELVADAPPIEAVLPNFLEFARGSVLVAHNARFDVGFLNRALKTSGYERLRHRVIDTATLARKILAGEVPNNRLATLAAYLRCAHRPCHRAFPDVLATIDVLHHLIERVAGFGVTTLEDLAAMSASRMDGTFHKISLAHHLPTGTGVYRFVGATGNTLYVGKASNIKARVRSYFYGDPRRRIRDLLRETQRVVAQPCATGLEAEIEEIRAIHQEQPPHNRSGKRSGTWYVKIDPNRAGKVAPARVPKDDGSIYLGPFASVRVARTLIDALRDAAAIHRCSTPESCKGCAFAQMDRCVGTDRDAHAREVQRVAECVTSDPRPIYDALAAKITRLARACRYEEAAEVRDRASRLANSLYVAAELRALLSSGELVAKLGNRMILVKDAQLAAAVDLVDGDVRGGIARLRAVATTRPVSSFFTAAVFKEARVLASALRRTRDLQLVHVDGVLAMPAGIGPDRFRPRGEDQSEVETEARRSRAARAAPESRLSFAAASPSAMS